VFGRICRAFIGKTLVKIRVVKKVPAFFVPKSDVGVINAEVWFTDFLVEHNIPLAASNHDGELFKKCCQIHRLHDSMVEVILKCHVLLKRWRRAKPLI